MTRTHRQEARKLFVTDWNGTLLDDAHLSRASANYVLSRLGIAPRSEAEHKAHYDMPISRYYEGLGVPPEKIATHAAQIVGDFLTHYTQNEAKMGLMRGSAGVLDGLQAQGVSCVVLSNHLRDSIAQRLSSLGVDCHIEAVLAYETPEGQAQHILPVGNATKRRAKSAFLADYLESCAGYARDLEMIVVGDSPEEMEIARAFNATSIAITRGYVSRARLEAARPDYLVSDFHEMRPLLRDKGFLP